MSQIDFKLSDVKPEIIAALKDGWKAVGATDERVEKMDARTLMMGPMAVNGLLMGYIDEIHGPKSQQAALCISRFEAHLLARHWTGEILATRARICFDGQVGTRECRWRAYGLQRLGALVEANLLTEAEIAQIEEEVRQEKGYPPFSEWPTSEPDLGTSAPQKPQEAMSHATAAGSAESPASAPQLSQRRPSWPEDDELPEQTETARSSPAGEADVPRLQGSLPAHAVAIRRSEAAALIERWASEFLDSHGYGQVTWETLSAQGEPATVDRIHEFVRAGLVELNELQQIVRKAGSQGTGF